MFQSEAAVLHLQIWILKTMLAHLSVYTFKDPVAINKYTNLFVVSNSYKAKLLYTELEFSTGVTKYYSTLIKINVVNQRYKFIDIFHILKFIN